MKALRDKARIVSRYALAPACIVVSVLLCLLLAGLEGGTSHPTGPFVLGVLAAAWFGGVGPGILAAFLAAICAPWTSGAGQASPTAFALLGGVFDVASFVTLGLTGAAVGWGRSSYRRRESALRELAASERQRAEETLRSRTQMFELAQKAAGAVAWEWTDGADPRRPLLWTPRADALFGMPPGGYDGTLKTWSKLVHRDDWPGVKVALAEASRSGEMDIEFRVVHPDGEVRWLHAKGRMFLNAAGKPIRSVGILIDITERKLVEEALRQSEERYAVAVDGANQGIFDWDLRSDRVFHSRRAQELFGLEVGDLWRERREWVAMIRYHPEDVPRIRSSIQRHLNGEKPTCDGEFRVLPRDGEVRWLRQRGIALRDASGKAYRMAGSIEDITERKRIEAELRSRKEMLEVAQKASRAVPWEWHNGAPPGVNRWSPELAAMFGVGPEAFDGMEDGWWNLCHPDDRRVVKLAIARAFATGEIDVEYRVVHPDGKVRWLNQKGRAFFDAQGAPARSHGFMFDVTERHKAEEDLRRMEQALRRAQRLEAIGTLSGGIAHDFNNILGVILGYGEMAMRDAKKGTRLRRDLESIMAAGERGRALVDRVLAFSRSGVEERVAVHVEEVVREALDQLSAKLPANITVDASLRAGRAAMLGDSTQVHQVVMNLAWNGVQAMAHGGVLRVALATERFDAERPATVGSITPGEYIAVEISDTGSGIPDDVLERMFDPFFTTKEVGVGSGLGLSLVHGIVTSVGGAIDVATRIGKGTTFTVYLPRTGDAPEKAADENQPLPRGEGQRVLVVDDEEPLVRLATETLEDLGYEPVGFTSSAAALAAFRADPARFDAMLTDERMPGMSGTLLIREVRDIRDTMPVVLMSGYLGMRSTEADVVVRKPLSARDLAACMARALRC